VLADIIGEVAGGIVRAAGRFIAEIAMHLFLELAVQGMGYVICKPFKTDVKGDGALVTIVGLLFWVLVLGAAYGTYRLTCETGAP
jgi:hypothetical protein